jgi:hypothetical protein
VTTDAFTSSALAVSTGTVGHLSYGVGPNGGGSATATRHGFYVTCNPHGVTVTKAPALGGVQAALAFPLSRKDAVELAEALYRAVN